MADIPTEEDERVKRLATRLGPDGDEWFDEHCISPQKDKGVKKHDRASRIGWSVMKGCSCKPGLERDNCPNCEGTGNAIDFNALYHTCPKCGKKGSGIKYKHKKHGCSGVKLSDEKDDDSWRSNIEAGESMSFRTGWSVVKDQCCDNKRMVERKDGTRRCRTCGTTERD